MTDKTIILGVDPGSRCTGYGIIWTHGTTYGHLAHGQIRTNSHALDQRLQQIHQGLLTIITNYQPDEIAIEQVFTFNNPQSALKLGQARGAALAATAAHQLPTAEYSARQIKLAVVGYGAATKSQVQHMIGVLLKLSPPLQSDAADALAIAICHANTRRYQQKVNDAATRVGETT